MLTIVNTYLSLRRAMGFKLKTIEKYLLSYNDFATTRGEQYIIGKTAIEWATLGSSAKQRANRLNNLIRFARFAHAENNNHEIPPSHVFCGSQHRRTPYVFTDNEINRLILYAGRLGHPNTLRPHTYSTLFGLLASTGLRISEALSLCFKDITSEGLIINETKFRKSRLVWLHETVIAALNRYIIHRQKFTGTDEHIFISRRGNKIGYDIAAETFQKVIKAAGIQYPSDKPKPRLHDLRHRFAIKSLETCPDNRDRIARHMLALSTYMGHARVESTYWYLNSTPQLMTDISSACESFMRGGAL